jgi:hypothetical protein
MMTERLPDWRGILVFAATVNQQLLEKAVVDMVTAFAGAKRAA